MLIIQFGVLYFMKMFNIKENTFHKFFIFSQSAEYLGPVEK